MSSLVQEYGVITTANTTLDEIEKHITDIESDEELSFFTPINVDSKSPEVVISGIALAEGRWKNFFYPYEEIKKSVKRLKNKNYIVEHGLNIKWKDKVVGKVFKVEASDTLRAMLYKARITDPNMAKEVMKGKWKGNSVRVIFDEAMDSRYGQTAKNLDYDNISFTNIPACRSCVIIQKELKQRLHDLSLDGGNSVMKTENDIGNTQYTVSTNTSDGSYTWTPSTVCPEAAELEDDKEFITKISKIMKGEGSEEDKMTAIQQEVSEREIDDMDTPTMFKQIMRRFDTFESRLKEVENKEGEVVEPTETSTEENEDLSSDKTTDKGEGDSTQESQEDTTTMETDKDAVQDTQKGDETEETTETEEEEVTEIPEPVVPEVPETTTQEVVEPTPPPETPTTPPAPPVEPTPQEEAEPDLSKLSAAALFVLAHRPKVPVEKRNILREKNE